MKKFIFLNKNKNLNFFLATKIKNKKCVTKISLADCLKFIPILILIFIIIQIYSCLYYGMFKIDIHFFFYFLLLSLRYFIKKDSKGLF